MKAWRFYRFNNMQLDEIPGSLLYQGHVAAEILCVQPSAAEAQLAYGICTLAYEQIKDRQETEAPIKLFGHEFCARIIDTNEESWFCPGDRVAACLQSLGDGLAVADTPEIQMGDSIVIFGQGSMGLGCMQVAYTNGAGNLIMVDVREEAFKTSKNQVLVTLSILDVTIPLKSFMIWSLNVQMEVQHKDFPKPKYSSKQLNQSDQEGNEWSSPSSTT